MLDRIHITGASGSGVTTLGGALAAALDACQIDTDDIFWLPSDPPYLEKRPVPERLHMLRALFRAMPRWVLSGALAGWGDPLIPDFQLVIYLYAPVETRLARLKDREAARFGDVIRPGGAMHQDHLDFLIWAARYDDPAMTGRSRHEHEAWLAGLSCPVLRLDGLTPTAEQVRQVTDFLAGPAQGIPPTPPIR